MSSSSSWYRVAAGMQMVAQAASQSVSSDLTSRSVRVAQHAVEVASKTSSSWYHPSTTAYPEPSFTPSPPPPEPKPFPADSHPLPQSMILPREPSTVLGSENPVDVSMESRELESSEVVVETFSNTFNQTRDQKTNETMLSSAVDHGASSSSPSLAQENQILSRSATSQQEQEQQEMMVRPLKEGRAVPSTRFGRAFGFAQLGMGLAAGAAAEGVSRLLGSGQGGSIMVNDSNSDRLAASLCRMRGAALKMGQMLSIQDESLLPPALSRALQQVRQGAEAMPNRQLVRQLKSQLGENWRDKFLSFEEAPFAAASIGQVHRAQISDPSTNKPISCVVKVQYPGVARSIESDLRNLSMLVTMTGLAPKGLFIENVIRVGQSELQVECDYLRELENQVRIKQLVEGDSILQENKFVVPRVFQSHSTEEVLTSEYLPGGTIDKVQTLDQEERNRIGRAILYLTMKELFEWRFMQTDPNWGNFLYNVGSRTTGLIDFGATRDYSKDFVDGYLRIVWASANRDECTLMKQSRRMQFLTGDENEKMLEAHKQSGFTVGEPFWEEIPFDFKGSQISTRMGQHTAAFLQHRLTPPPEEVYTLHRKLAGAYMLCIKLGAVVESRSMLKEFVEKHEFEDGLPHPIHG